MKKRLRGGIFLAVVFAAFALAAPVSANPGGASDGSGVRMDNARPITLAQQQRQKGSQGESPSKYWWCGAYAKTHKCTPRWDIRSGSCVCAGR